MSGNWRYCPYSSVLTGKCLSFSSLFNYTWKRARSKYAAGPVFQCCLECHKQGETAGSGVRQSQADLTDPGGSSKRGRSGSGGVAAPSAPPAAAGAPAAQRRPGPPARPHPSPASSGPEPYRAPAVLRWGRPPRRPAHQLARSAPRPCLGSPGSSPHKERRSDLRVNLAGPRANTIGRLFTNEPPSAWRHHPQRTQLLGIPCFLNENRKPGSFENVGSSFQCCQE